MSTNKVMYKRNVSQDIDERTKRCVIKYYERLISENTSRKKMSVIYANLQALSGIVIYA